MPYVIKEEKIPDEFIAKIDRHNKVMMSSIVILIVTGGVTRSFKDLCHLKNLSYEKENILNVVRMIMICVVYVIAIIVGVYLFVAVYKIKNFLVREGIKIERINKKMMLLHTATFGLFLFSIIGVECM
jgi:hypothetical protein